MKRVVVFAHYDKDNIVDDYVIYYLKAIKEIADDIIFVSCNPLKVKNKLDGLASFIIDEQHNEYDFGSYKRGFFYLKNNNLLQNYDELIFANDSCYGPFYSLTKVFEKMDNTADFWGITKNKFGMIKKKNKFYFKVRPHIQSYFLVFNKKIFMSDIFSEFCSSIKHMDIKNDIILNYEIGLSELLVKNNFTCNNYIKNYARFNAVLIYFWRQLIEKYDMPFVKCSILRLYNPYMTSTYKWQDSIKKVSNYPVEIIEKNLERTSNKKSILFYFGFVLNYYFYIFGFMPGIIKKIIGKINNLLHKINF